MVPLLPGDRRWRWVAIGGYVIAGLLIAALLAIAAMPVGWLKPVIEQQLSDRFGRTVTIASLERREAFSLAPTVVAHDIVIPQPAWAGRGTLARVKDAEVTFPAFGAIVGRFRPTAVTVRGATLDLIRTKDRRINWRGTTGRGGSNDDQTLDQFTLVDTRIRYRDALRDREVLLSVAADPVHGLVGRGIGKVRGSPVRVALRGGPVGGGGRWPFRADIAGPDLTMRARGSMAGPLDTAHLSLDVTAQARSLTLIDAVIEAGLIETRPVDLKAHLDRAGDRWTVTGLAGKIGATRIAGRITIDKQPGDSRIDGRMVADGLRFTDFSSPEGSARAAARERAIGLRLVPDTPIDIANVGAVGRIAFDVRSIVDAGAIKAMSGVVSKDGKLMRVSPLTIGLRRGAIRGSVVVDQRGDAATPRVAYDLRLTGSDIEALGGGGGTVTGEVAARALLAGRGETIRQSVANSDGRIGLVARDGALPKKIADALGFDAGRALFEDDEERAGLRCVVIGFGVKRGVGRAGPFVVDTTQSRLDGSGTLTFPGEALAIRLTGAPKKGSILRLPGSALLSGSIREPDLVIPKQVKSIGNVFRAIGRAITGKQGPTATDADCGALAAAVLR